MDQIQKPSQSPIKAVVMAGGEGTRLKPITVNIPKPLVPVGNRPIMEHILNLLRRHHIKDITATLWYLSDEIQAYFGNGQDFGVNLNYSIESTPLGTAGSVKKAEEHLQDGTFLIISGDALTDCDLTKAIAFHREKKSLATLILCTVPSPLEFGVVITDSENRVVRFLEKPGWSEVFSDTVNTGMYILEPEIFKMMEHDTVYDWSGDIFPKLLAKGLPMYGYIMEEYWCDVGSLTQYREAQADLLSGRVDLPILDEPSESSKTGIFLGPNTTVEDGVILVPPIYLGRNCRVKKGAKIGPYTVLGDNTYVESDATINRSVVWDNVYIGHKANLSSAIVGSRAIIKRDVSVRDEAVIGDRCLLDAGCTVKPRIKIWPDKTVERGSTVTMTMVWGNKWRGNLFRDLGVAGLSNIEITPDFSCRLASAFGSCVPPKTRIVTSRDSTRSSRMIKRAVISSLLSAGCDVLDLRSMAVPIARHFISVSGAGGAIHIRKLPGNNRVTLIEMFDKRGLYLSKNQERKVESSFFREDYRRADAEELGQIEFASRAVEGYQSDFFKNLEKDPLPPRKLRVVCDYGYSSMASYFPAMLARLGVETMSLSAFDDGKKAPRTEQEIESHLANLQTIVRNVGFDIGVLFTSDGERMTLIDETGEIIRGHQLFATIAYLIQQETPHVKIAVTVTAPAALENELVKNGALIVRTKADVHSLMEVALSEQVTFAGDDKGGFIFPEMQIWFDGPYTFGKLIVLLRKSGLTLKEINDKIPRFFIAYESVAVSWEAKGTVMRRLAEEASNGAQVELMDGIKLFDQGAWALILPDAVEPIVHIYAEGDNEAESKELATRYAVKVTSYSNE